MENYFGLPFDFKVTPIKGGDEIILENDKASFLVFFNLDIEKYKIQQFTGVLDRNKQKIYFGDTLRFADKVEWYRNQYWAKVSLGTMTKKEALEKIEASPYEERLIEGKEDFEWLLSGEIQTYWEIVN